MDERRGESDTRGLTLDLGGVHLRSKPMPEEELELYDERLQDCIFFLATKKRCVC